MSRLFLSGLACAMIVCGCFLSPLPANAQDSQVLLSDPLLFRDADVASNGSLFGMMRAEYNFYVWDWDLSLNYHEQRSRICAVVGGSPFQNVEILAALPFELRQWPDYVKTDNTGRVIDESARARNFGLGDIVLFGRYGLLNETNSAKQRLAVALGVRLPNASTQNDQERFDDIHPPLGKGSWDIGFALAWRMPVERFDFQVKASHWINGTFQLDEDRRTVLYPDGEINNGDRFNLQAFAGMHVLEQLMVRAGISYLNVYPDSYDGEYNVRYYKHWVRYDAMFELNYQLAESWRIQPALILPVQSDLLFEADPIPMLTVSYQTR